MKKFFSAFMAMVLMVSVFSFNFLSYAAEAENTESEIMPCWTTIDSYSADLYISGLTAYVGVTLNSSYYTNLKIVVQLQKETSTGYEDVKTWTATKTSGVTLSVAEEKIINPFNDYRLRITFTADQESIVVFKYP